MLFVKHLSDEKSLINKGLLGTLVQNVLNFNHKSAIIACIKSPKN